MDEVRTAQMPSAAVVPGNRVQAATEAIRIGPGSAKPAGKNHKAARVELIRENDVVRAFEVICSCGERIIVRCDYE